MPLGLAWEALQNRWKTRQDWSRRAFTHRHSYTSLDFVGGIQTATSHVSWLSGIRSLPVLVRPSRVFLCVLPRAGLLPEVVE